MKQIRDLKLEVLPHLLYSPDLASSYCHPFRSHKKPSTWMSLHIGWGDKGGSAWLAGTGTKRLLLHRNLCLSGKVKVACRTCWGLCWRLISLYSVCFCYKLPYIILSLFWRYIYYFEAAYNISGFHLNNPCIICQPESEVTYFPAHKTHRDFFIRNFRKKK